MIEAYGIRILGLGMLAGALLLAPAPADAQEEAAPLSTPVASAPPTLKADTAIYHMDQGMLQYAFTFVNPSDSVLFLDCQIPPHAALSGNTLILTFDRKPGPTAGGPVGGAVNPEDFPPQRVQAHQTFQGQRRLDRVLGDPNARPRFAKVGLRMAYYPERTEGEGERFRADQGGVAEARPVNVIRKGKAPAPPKVRKFRVPKDSPPAQ